MTWTTSRKKVTEITVSERAVGVTETDENGSSGFLDIETGSTPLSPLSPASSSRNLLGDAGDKEVVQTATASAAKRQSTLRRVWRWWRAEILFSIASIFFLSIIITILSLADGGSPHLISRSGGSWLTLNGLVALLATMNKACLTAPVCSAMTQEMWLYFDSEAEKQKPSSKLWHMDLYHQAANSTWGSLKFIRHLRTARLTTCIGCIITIFSLAYSTFAQQLFTISSTSDGDAIPSIPYTLQFVQESITTSFTNQFTAAIYAGVFGTAPSYPTLPCNGNCTWPWTPSLGVCGGCKNSTFSEPHDCAHGLCNYTLPTGDEVQLADWSQPAETQYMVRQTYVSMLNRGNLYNSSTFDVPYITHFSLFGIPFNMSQSGAGSNMKVAHDECALWICVNVYGTDFTSGVTGQMIFPSSEDFVYNPQYPQYWDFPNLPGDVPAPADGIKISVYEDAISAMPDVFNQTIQGQVYSRFGTPPTPQDPSPFIGAEFSSPLMSSIWAGGIDPETFMDDIATSLSAVVRNADNQQQTNTWPDFGPYAGASYDLAIVVRWRWIILPIGLVLSSIAFLVLVIVKTSRNERVAGWKGSPLTLLLFDVDESIREEAKVRVMEHHGIRKAVGKVTVRFMEEEGGGRKFKAL